MTEHFLREVAGFQTRHAGWKDTPGGGSVPIRESLDEPYFRFYCKCGVIGTKQPTKEAARAQHIEHAKLRQPVLTDEERAIRKGDQELEDRAYGEDRNY
jgi:hypothetical protein